MVFLNNLWQFGSQELIASISALATLLAVIVSLVLSRKGKVIKYKIVLNKDYPGLSIYNTGHAKFNLTCFGIIDGDKYYLNDNCRYSKIVANQIPTNYNGKTNQEVTINAMCSEPGDFIEVGLEYFDFSVLKEKKHYLFIKINGKIKKIRINSKEYSLKNVDMSNYLMLSKKEICHKGYFLRK